MTRTIVISDLHGSTTLLDAILEHASFSSDDRLVVAGDMIDVGSQDVVSAVQELGATVLVGNHEAAAAIGLRISPQSSESLARGGEFASNVLSGAWSLAAVVDDWLVTHAGVSVALEDVVTLSERDPARIAEALNALFREEVERALAESPLTPAGLDGFRLLGGEMGPLWFRPFELSHIPSGLRQIVGHTPPELLPAQQLSSLEAHGWRLVEPGHRAGSSGTVRYAVVEHGLARVIEG